MKRNFDAFRGCDGIAGWHDAEYVVCLFDELDVVVKCGDSSGGSAFLRRAAAIADVGDDMVVVCEEEASDAEAHLPDR